MDNILFEVRNTIELFDKEKPWAYIRVPKSQSSELRSFSDRGLIAIKAKVGHSTWNTSLMPMGDGTHFIPLPKKIRMKEVLDIGDSILLVYVLRTR